MNLAQYERMERMVYDVAQTHLSEFHERPFDLYPDDEDGGRDA